MYQINENELVSFLSNGMVWTDENMNKMINEYRKKREEKK